MRRCPPNTNNGYGTGWAGEIYPFVKSTGVYGCPDDPTQVGTGDGRAKESYGLNLNIEAGGQFGLYDYTQLNPGGGKPNTNFPNLSGWNSPANTVMLFEVQNVGRPAAGGPGINVTDPLESEGDGSGSAAGLGSNGGTAANVPISEYLFGIYATGQIGGDVGSGQAPNRTTGVHSDGSNWLACDGHVKWLRGVAVSGGAYASDPNQPEVDSAAANTATASGTSKMTLSDGKTGVALTFSPI